MPSQRRHPARNAQRVARALSRRRPGGYQNALADLKALYGRTDPPPFLVVHATWPQGRELTLPVWGLAGAVSLIVDLAEADGDRRHLTQGMTITFENLADRNDWLDEHHPDRRAFASLLGQYLTGDGRRVAVTGLTVAVSPPDPAWAALYRDLAAASPHGFAVRMPDGASVTVSPVSRHEAEQLADPSMLRIWNDMDDTPPELSDADARVLLSAWSAGLTPAQIRELPQLRDVALSERSIDLLCAAATSDDIDALPSPDDPAAPHNAHRACTACGHPAGAHDGEGHACSYGAVETGGEHVCACPAYQPPPIR
jgi:hypothetical protein